MWRCDICAEMFETVQHFREHTTSHPKPYKCPHCTRKYAILKELWKHCRSHTKPIKRAESFKCSYCGQKFTSKQLVRRHMFSKHLQISNPTYICDICGHDFKSTKILDNHRLLHSVHVPDYVPINR